jgi:hypothetical protein
MRDNQTYSSTKSPNVYRNCPWHVEHDFRGTIYWSAYDVLPVIRTHILGNGVSEVTKLEGIEPNIELIMVYKDIIRFDVCISRA